MFVEQYCFVSCCLALFINAFSVVTSTSFFGIEFCNKLVCLFLFFWRLTIRETLTLDLYNPGWIVGTIQFFTEMVLFCIGISHKPSWWFRIPLSTILLFLMASNCSLFKNTVQSSLHNCPIDISDALFNCGRIKASFASFDKISGNGSCPLFVALIYSSFGVVLISEWYFQCLIDTLNLFLWNNDDLQRYHPLLCKLSYYLICEKSI